MSKFTKREDFNGDGEALLKAGRVERVLIGKDATVSYLKECSFTEEEIAKASDGLDDESAVFPFVLSTSSVDREGDSIEQEGWELGNYKKNPVVLWAHDYAELPVGRASMVFVRDGKLRAIDRFTGAHELARTVEQLYKEGVLNAVSVGFQPIEFEFAEDRGFFSMDFKRQELLEHSAVPVPAHPEALLEARGKSINLDPLNEFYEKALDESGFLLVPRNYLEACEKATRPARKVKTAELVTAEDEPTIEEPDTVIEPDTEIEPVKTLADFSENELRAELKSREPPPEAKPALTAAHIKEITSALKEELSAPFKEQFQKLKTDLTGQLD